MQIKVTKGAPRPKNDFLEKLRAYFGNKVEIIIQNNKASLLRIERSFNTFRIFMHHLFYELTDDLFEMLYLFSKGGKKAKIASKAINSFIESKRHLVVRENMQGITRGKVYDLEQIFSLVNQRYFEGKLDLFLTWVLPRKKRYTRTTLGSFEPGWPKGLIKINQILDSIDVPSYFIEYVVYHEALHHLFPIKMNHLRRVIHSRDFREKEKEFRQYTLAKKWEKEVFSKAVLR